MANKRLIKFYKGYCIKELYKYLNDENYQFNDLDYFIKSKVNLQDKSCIEMDNIELYELIYKCFEIGDKIGLKLNFPDNEWQN